MRYRKKPVVIDAWQFTKGNLADIPEEFKDSSITVFVEDDVIHAEIETLEGVMTANEGDWIIKGVNGEFYPCKPDIFEKTYVKEVE